MPLSGKSKIVQDGDWLLLPRKQGLSFSITWRQDDEQRRERFNLLEGFFSQSTNFQFPTAEPVLVWVANVYYEERFGEQMYVGYPNEHVRSKLFGAVGTEGNWVKRQIDKNFYSGQDKAQNPKKRWIVYQPEDWTPKQANFMQGAFESLAAQAFPEAVKAVTTKGLKAVDVTGLVATALDNSGLWDLFKDHVKNWLNDKLRDALHQFGSNAPNVKPEQVEAEKKRYEDLLGLAMAAMKERAPGRPADQQTVLANLAVWMEMGLMDDVPDEPAHNVPR